MRLSFIYIAALSLITSYTFSQGITRQTYHDPERKHIKEIYVVKDTIRNVLHGKYISYFLNGSMESKGEFANNETSGIWEFYYENTKLKMRGILFKGANYGMWEYFYESGRKSMEGIIYGKNREGEWKSYYENGQVKEIGEYKDNKRIGIWKNFYEDGAIKGEGEFNEDTGRYTEYYHSGKVEGDGPRSGVKNVGHWRFYSEDGTLESEGDFENGKRHGEWIKYFPSGKVYSKGSYVNDEPSGNWQYYFEDGTLSTSGEFLAGKKNGLWKTMNANGTVKSEATFTKGSGEFREYYPSGKLKVKGNMVDGKRQGKWEFYYEDGKKEGSCDFNSNRGTYYGYYPNGTLQTKGTLEGDLKTGTWEIYEKDGKLSGYYKPFYNDKASQEIVKLVAKSSSYKGKSRARGFNYFKEKSNEFHGVIVGTNPVWMAVGRLPLCLEFYVQERIGHEFEFVGIRDPFFKADEDIAPGKRFTRGYSVSIRQKFYNPMKAGMWYFGHEIRFTNFGHFINEPISMQNPDDIFTFNAVEQRIAWGPLVGYRMMKKNNRAGFTIDGFVSFNIGYRSFEVDDLNAAYFEELDQSKLVTSFNVGLNFGNVFSFR